MGDKVRAKEAMRAAGVPLVPGSDGAVGLSDLRRAAAEQAFPVLLKASAGGGGKGMRLVSSADDLEDAFGAASAEAEGGVRRRLGLRREARRRPRATSRSRCCATPREACSRSASVSARSSDATRSSSRSRRRRRSTTDARGDGVDGRDRVRGDRLPERRNVRVPRRSRTAPSTSSRSTAGCRSSIRCPSSSPGSTSSASRSGSQPASSSRRPAARPGAGTRSRSASTPRILRAAFCPSPGTVTRFVPPLGPGVRVDTAVALRRRRSRRTTTP